MKQDARKDYLLFANYDIKYSWLYLLAGSLQRGIEDIEVHSSSFCQFYKLLAFIHLLMTAHKVINLLSPCPSQKPGKT
jgi:hypothetical protein